MALNDAPLDRFLNFPAAEASTFKAPMPERAPPARFFGQAAETWRHTIDPNVMGSVDLWQDPRHGCEEDPSGEFNALYYDFKSKIADVTEA